MNKKIIGLLSATMVVFLSQTAAWADFNPGQYAEDFSRNGLIPYGSNTSGRIRIIDIWQHYDASNNYDAYAPSTFGYLDPNWERYSEYDMGLFVPMWFNDSSGTFWRNDYYFSTFSLTSNIPTGGYYETRGTLSYDNGATRTSDGTAINLGVVYLYTQYATGKLYGYDYVNNSNAAELNEAFQFLMGNGSSDTTWTSNRFLDHLVTEPGSSGTWLMPYDLTTEYPAWVDNNYAVYVMNLERPRFVFDPDNMQAPPTTVWDSIADVLYLVQRDSVAAVVDPVPEPATLLLWSAIGLGMFEATRFRKKRKV